MFLVDRPRPEELRVAPCMGLAVYQGAQPRLGMIILVGAFHCLEHADLGRHDLAGREFDLDASAFLKAFLELVLAPSREPVPYGDAHDVGLVFRAALNDPEWHHRAYEVVRELLE